jgi:hypothetical protein
MRRKERSMRTIEENAGMDPEVRAKMQEVCDRLVNGPPFTQEERKKAAAEIDRMRDENLKRFGVQNIAVDLVCELRDSR